MGHYTLDKPVRQLAAELARQLFKKEISFDQLILSYPYGPNDRDIQDLFDLIEHESKKSELLGASYSDYADYQNDIENLIRNLKAADK